MSEKQKPCPLCGRDMTAIETHPGRGELYCGHCDLVIGGNEAKTPEELTELMDNSEHGKLKVENMELRELVRAAWACINTTVSCYDCRLTLGGCTLQSAMREFGVEVGE